jgi:hypothetical protein
MKGVTGSLGRRPWCRCRVALRSAVCVRAALSCYNGTDAENGRVSRDHRSDSTRHLRACTWMLRLRVPRTLRAA